MLWHTVTHGRSEGETDEWSEYPVPFTLPRNMVYPALLPLMRTPRLPVVDWTDDPADLNGLVRFSERRNMVSAREPSHFNWPLTLCVRRYTSQQSFCPFLISIRNVYRMKINSRTSRPWCDQRPNSMQYSQELI